MSCYCPWCDVITCQWDAASDACGCEELCVNCLTVLEEEV